jgi:choline dehydrogenase-like flavoprotein
LAEALSADIVIIGSGVAGSLIAHELAMSGASVLMLEAGPDVPRWRIVENYRNNPARDDNMAPYPPSRIAPHPEYPAYAYSRPPEAGTELGPGEWPGSVVPYQPGNSYLILKGQDAAAYAQQYIRWVGGTTWHWAAATWRFLPNDFRLRSRYGVGRDWPVSYDQLESYYYRAEVALGCAGPNDGTDLGSPRTHPYPMDGLPLSYNDQRFADALNSNGFTVVAEPAARNSTPYDSRPTCCGNNNCMPICPIGAMYNGVVHAEKARQAGARLIADAVVYRIEIGSDDRVVAVHYKDGDGASHRVTGKRFVVAANGIETPRLLLFSADDRRPGGIANSSDQVGRNMMDHPGTGVTFLAEESLWPGRGAMEMSSVVNFRDGSFRSEYAAKKLHLNNQSQTRKATLKALSMGLSGARLEHEVRFRAAHTVNINSFHEILANPDNRLVLSRDHKDVLGIPHAEITYNVGDYVRRSAAHTHDAYARIAQLMGGTEIVFNDAFAPNNHIMGSVIMGNDPKDSVVDGECRTHDHENLYLATSGVMPTAGSVNCTLTLSALSLRIADALKSGG